MRWNNRSWFALALSGAAVLGMLGFTDPAAAADATNATIRKVDFRNFAYDVGEGEIVTTKDGEFIRDNPEDKLYLQVVGVDYGDLDGNKTEEAAVWLLLNTGGTGQFTYTQVFNMVGGKPTFAAQTGVGDRAYEGLHDVFVDAGQLVEDRYTNGRGACCPNEISRFRYRLKGSKLAPTGLTPKRSIVFLGAEAGDQKVVTLKFLKGTSAATVYTDNTQPVDVLLAARVGQTVVIKPVQTRDSGGLPGVTIFDNGKKIGATTGKGLEVKLPTGKVRLTFTGEGFVDIAIR